MVNVRAPHLLVQALLPHIAEKDGRVINMFVLLILYLMTSDLQNVADHPGYLA